MPNGVDPSTPRNRLIERGPSALTDGELLAVPPPTRRLEVVGDSISAGYGVDGPYRDTSAAMLGFQKDKPDVAILDVQLNDGTVFGLAEKLAQENVPIIFHSGNYTHDDVVKKFPNATTLQKPCPPSQMLAAVNGILASA